MGRVGINKSEDYVEQLYGEFKANILPRLERFFDETRRYLYFLAWLNSRMEEEKLGRIIVTGGFAVEVYTGRVYRTMDVDIIAENCSQLVERFLSRFSEKIARGYLPRLDILTVKSIDIVSVVYDRKMPPVKLIVDEDNYVYLEPPEELIVSYLSGWKYWSSSEDRDKALWVLVTWRNKLNLEYVKSRAREEEVEDKLEELLKISSGII